MIYIKKIIGILLAICIIFATCLTASAAELKLSKYKLQLPVGFNFKVTVIGTQRKVKWESSDKKIASVSAKGNIRAKSEGKATITATVGKTVLKCKVNVKTLLIAHRGFSSEYPENSVESFKAAFKNGFDGIEVDLWESKNGDLMIHHDATTERVCKKKAYIWNVNRNNREKYPITKANGVENLSEKPLIPTLTETARIVAKNKGYLLLHIKSKGALGYYLSNKGAAKVVKILQKYGIAGRTMIFTSGTSSLNLFFNRKIKLGINLSKPDKAGFKKVVAWCKQHKIETLVLGSISTIRRYGKEKNVINYAKERGVKIGIYNCKSPNNFQLLKSLSADFVMSDYMLEKTE